MKFNIGMRVRVYLNPTYVQKGVVSEVVTPQRIQVRIDRRSMEQEEVEYLYCHPKQCRKLKPKVKRKPRTLWVKFEKTSPPLSMEYPKDVYVQDVNNECVEFIEVIK